MGKQHRGKGIAQNGGGEKGKCPLCGRTNTKLLWDVTNEKKEVIKVCKRCRNK